MGCGSSKPKKEGATARRGSKHGSDDLCVSAADDEYYSARMLLAATGIAPLSAAGVHASVAGYGVHGDREAARGKALRHVFPLWGGSGSVDAAKHTPLCVQSWCALGVDAPISAADKAQLPQAVAWLSFALRTAYLDLRIRDASRAAMEGHAFACSLPHARQWAPLKESLREHLHALSLELQEDDNFNRVGVQLSDEVVAPMCRYHRDFVPGEPASQAGVLPRIPGFFDFAPSSAHLMHEHVYTHVLVMLGMAVGDLFAAKAAALGKQFGLTKHRLQVAAPKTHAHATRKTEAERRRASESGPSPRCACNTDVVRCLMSARDPATALKLLRALMHQFAEGIATVDNEFALDPGRRAEHFHLLAVVVTVVFEPGLTYSQLAGRRATRAAWDAHCARCPDDSVPAERWRRHTARAREYLEHEHLAKLPVKLLGEVRVTIDRHCDARHMMHAPRKVWRAADSRALHADCVAGSAAKGAKGKGKGKAGAAVEQRGAGAQQTLLMAAYHGQLSVVASFLEQGHDVDETGGPEGGTALYFAAQRNHVDVAHRLLEGGADADAADHDGRGPLFFAAQFGHVDVVRLLVARGASTAQQDANGGTALSIASRLGHLLVVQLLCDAGADANVETRHGTAVDQAQEFGHGAVVAYLQSRGRDTTVLV